MYGTPKTSALCSPIAREMTVKNNILVKMCKEELYKMNHSYNYTSYNFNHYGNCVLLKFLDVKEQIFFTNQIIEIYSLLVKLYIFIYYVI